MSSHIPGIKKHFSKSKKVELSLGVVVVGGGGVSDMPYTPPPTTTSNFDKKIFLSPKQVEFWGGGCVPY